MYHPTETFFYPRDSKLARVFARATCPSVCITPVLYQTKKSTVMISSLYGSAMILVFWCQISTQNSKGVIPSRGVKREGWVKSAGLPTWRCTSAGNSDRNVSVRLSQAGIVFMKKASVMISSSGSPMILVFWCQISSRYSKGFHRAGASNKGEMGKFSHFLALSINISKTIADRAKVTIND